MLNHNTKLFTQRAAPLMASATLGRQRARVQPKLTGCAWLSPASWAATSSSRARRRFVAMWPGQAARDSRLCGSPALPHESGVMQLAFTHRSTTAPSPREQRNDRALASERERAVLAGGTTSHNLTVAQLF